ncbi:MAG: TIGR03560 family F420-dependent LLM class oxidoreductase [Chloroflexi bacterium]|nr:TIGR03560 family F420-dependent LLM class oxidoreductase [Chloroflexota bacterium]
MQIALTIEGQRGLTWQRWQRLVLAVEALGFAGLYRSDHFVDAHPPDQDSLELWTSLTWLADNTKRIEFGPLVTPLSFRHPVHTARMARDVDDLSQGRLVLGVGAGWEGGRREYNMFGFELLSTNARFARFEEGLQVITRLLREPSPQTFSGRFYRLQDAILLPRPKRETGPPILVGGNGPTRLLPLAAKYADEWNAIFRTPKQFAALNHKLNQLLDESRRPRHSVIRSQMMGLIFGRNQAALQKKLQGNTVESMWRRGFVAGTPSQIVDQLSQLEEAGVQKVMLQWTDLDDIAGLETLADFVLPQLQTNAVVGHAKKEVISDQ